MGRQSSQRQPLLNLTKSSSSKQAQKAVRIESGKDVGAGSCAGQLVHALIARKHRGRCFIATKDTSIAARKCLSAATRNARLCISLIRAVDAHQTKK